ncbi:site-specific integrase [uncultured Tenacibaculum sp.]|uniref:tyrosine-type recombinase/integrase n=1 Tax=uncultured Tenacibaculum sp. TaxID=174713 RepID=UPI00262244E2|nr:site-specific integrase [uncultured Tenacibaculum sp.]
MSKFKNSNSAKMFIDYKPAELRKNNDWLIVYYSKIPATNQFKRFRIRVPKISPYRERLEHAKKMTQAINNKLANGWSPFYEDTGNKYRTLDEVFEKYFLLIEKEINDGVKRIDTLRSYKSFHRIFINFVKENHALKLLVEVDIHIVSSFLDYIYIQRRVSPITFNNYLQFLNTFFSWCMQKGYLVDNPAKNFKNKPKTAKIRTVLTPEIKKYLKEYGSSNKEYYTLCMCIYYAFIRKTELTKIKVANVNLKKDYITIDASSAKNKKTENVTIPNQLKPFLEHHLKNAKLSDFVFSQNDFKPGNKQLNPKKVSDQWALFRKEYKIPLKFQFYSLKDTGITDLLNSGIPSIKVRDQARHHDLKITEAYTKRNDTYDLTVKNADFKF